MSTTLNNKTDLAAHAYESEHVHDVYDSIAAHFSETRYKPWPVVDSFLRSLNPGAIGLDVGCGNGKYLSVRDDVYILGSDYATELVRIASQHEPHSSLVADSLNLPHPYNVFDFAICIAVIHHFSTRQRRIEAVQHVLEKLRTSSCGKSSSTGGFPDTRQQNFGHREPRNADEALKKVQTVRDKDGEALFFVWALEQKNSRRGWDESHEQDVLVPWVLKPKSQSQNLQNHEEIDPVPTTYHRYYHLYRRHELEEDIFAAGGEVLKSGYDRDNWWCVARRKVPLP